MSRLTRRPPSVLALDPLRFRLVLLVGGGPLADDERHGLVELLVLRLLGAAAQRVDGAADGAVRGPLSPPDENPPGIGCREIK